MKDILIQRLKKHDEAAFEEVMNKYLPLVSNIVYNIGRDGLSKEDMEETMFRVHLAEKQSLKSAPFFHFLFLA